MDRSGGKRMKERERENDAKGESSSGRFSPPFGLLSIIISALKKKYNEWIDEIRFESSVVL